jgi:8-oxo-dGTP pyrophosphatase MutT (NUDIX family)
MTDIAPVPAASVILLRGQPYEVLMIRRHAKASFVPNAWVFPGGAVDAADERGSIEETMRAAAVRELFEETRIWVDPEQLVWTSRWITPEGLPKRFDTYFFLARAGIDAEAVIDQQEAVDVVWLRPDVAIETLDIVFPTLKNLEAIAGFPSIDALLESRRGADVQPTRPRMLMVGGKRTFVLP